MKSKKLARKTLETIFRGSTVVMTISSSALASSGSWNVNAAGNWSSASNWTPAAVPGTTAGDAVSLTNNISAARTVTIDATPRIVGTLNIGDSNGTHAFTLAASSGGTLTFNNSGSGASLGETGNIIDTISTNVILADNLTITTAGASSTGEGIVISGVISETGGAKSIVKNGSGGLRLTGTNTYTGGTIINAGDLQVGNSAALGTGSITINGGALSARGGARTLTNTVSVGGNFTLGATGTNNLITLSGNLDLGGAARVISSNSGQTATISGVISNGGLTKAGVSQLTISGVNTYTGDTTINTGTLAIGGAGQLNSGIYAGTIFNSGTFNYGSTSNQTLSGLITGTGSLVKNGVSTLTLTGGNDYIGGTTIGNGGGIIAITNGGALGGGAVQIGAGGSDADGTLQVSNGITVANNINIGGVNTLTKTRIENVSGTNTLSGSIAFSTAGGSNATIGSLSGMLNLTGNMTASVVTGSRTFVFGGSGDISANGVISNGSATVALRKDGAGTLTLNGANTYSGPTIVDGGELAVGASGSIAYSSAVVLNGGEFNVSAVAGGYVLVSGQTLSGSGSVTGDLTVNGSLSIGASPGTITFNDNLTLGNGSVSNFEFTVGTFSANSYDLALGGTGSQTASFDGTLNLFFDIGETYLNNSSVKIFDFESYAGTFTSVTYTGLGAGQSAAFDSATGIVTVIPEPGTAALGGLGLLMLLRRRR